MKSRELDLAEQLKFLGAQTELISGAFGTGDSEFISHALGTTARAFGMTDPSSESGGPHEALYRALHESHDPRGALCHTQPSQLERPARPETADRGICGQHRAPRRDHPSGRQPIPGTPELREGRLVPFLAESHRAFRNRYTVESTVHHRKVSSAGRNQIHGQPSARQAAARKWQSPTLGDITGMFGHGWSMTTVDRKCS